MKLTVIGAGPGGYEAAIYAAKKGLEVTIIEKDKLGGTCLNRGCIPTKAFLASSEILGAIEEAKSFGIEVSGDVNVDYPAIVARKDKVMGTLVKGIGALMKANKVTVINGFGKMVDKNTVEVTKEDGSVEVVKTDYIILATGSVPVAPRMFKYDKKTVITSDEVLDLKEAPKSMVIVGGGVIGCEIGQFLAKVGTEVTIVEMLPRILATMDEDVSKQLARQFKKDKVKVICGDGVAEVNPGDGEVTLKLSSGTELTAQYCLLAMGRAPFIAGCGCEEVGVALTERGRIAVNEYLQTSVDNIYAIGDILASTQLAHVASKEGFVAVDNILGKQKKIEYHAVPGCVFTDPEIATVGLAEQDCEKANIAYKKGYFELKVLGKAQASGKLTGFVKVLTDESDVIIGAAIVGAHATDMLQVLTTATQLRLTAEAVGDSIFPHPTMCEGIMEALHDLHGVSVHKA